MKVELALLSAGSAHDAHTELGQFLVAGSGWKLTRSI